MRQPPVNKLVLSLVALSLVPGCPLLEAEVDVPEVCITHDGVHVGAAAEVHERIVVDDLSGLHELAERAEELTFARAEVIATSGIAELGFVETARIAISPGAGDSTVPPLTLHACDGDCVSRADSLDLSAEEQHDVLAYLRGDAITLDLDLTGDLPQVAWTLSVVVCFEGTARYELTP